MFGRWKKPKGACFPPRSCATGRKIASWGESFTGRDVIVICRNGRAVSPGVAPWLRHHGADAQVL
jgi:hypothetical protein